VLSERQPKLLPRFAIPVLLIGAAIPPAIEIAQLDVRHSQYADEEAADQRAPCAVTCRASGFALRPARTGPRSFSAIEQALRSPFPGSMSASNWTRPKATSWGEAQAHELSRTAAPDFGFAFGTILLTR